MRIRSPLPPEREPLIEMLSQGATFRPEEVSCAIELLDAALAQADGNTYEALVALDDVDYHDGDGGNTAGGERLLGYTCFGRTPMTEATFDLYWLVVSAAARGRGMGRALMAALEDQLRSRGARTVRVETSSLEGQGGACRFYEKTGYHRAGVIPDFYRPGDDLVIFTKVL